MDLMERLDMFLGCAVNEETEYQKYFKAKLKEFGVESPDELEDSEKKKFYAAVDKGWKSKDEKKGVSEQKSCDEEE